MCHLAPRGVYYLRDGLHLPRLAWVFALIGGVANLFTTPFTQPNSIASVITSEFPAIPAWGVGVFLAIISWLVIVDVLWWFRNRVGPENFAVQGYNREKMYPDFVVQQTSDGRKFHHVLVLESKGEHLEGNPDTTYKRNVAEYFTKTGHRVSWQKLGADFKDHVFRFQILDQAQDHGRDWSDALSEILNASD